LLLVRFNEDDNSNSGGNVKAKQPSSARSTSRSGKRRSVRKDKRVDAAATSSGVGGDEVEQPVVESEQGDQTPADDAVSIGVAVTTDEPAASLEVQDGEQAIADAEHGKESEVADSAAAEEEATIPAEAGADAEAVPVLDDTPGPSHSPHADNGAAEEVTVPSDAPPAVEEAPPDVGGNEEGMVRTKDELPPKSTTSSSSDKRTYRTRDHDRIRNDKVPLDKGDRSMRSGRSDHDLRREQRYHGKGRRRHDDGVAPIVRIGRAMRLLVRWRDLRSIAGSVAVSILALGLRPEAIFGLLSAMCMLWWSGDFRWKS
jgi:hypothetical protein